MGTGKTRAIACEGIKLAYLNSGRMGLIGAPTYPMLRDVTRLTFIETLEDEGIPYVFHKSDNSIELIEPGSMVVFRAVEEYERLRGTNLAWFGLDELTYCPEPAWLRLEARLRDPKAEQLCGFAGWTPKGFDWVYHRFVGPQKRKGYKAVLAAPGENTSLPDDFYERLKGSYDERFYAQEVLGEYLSIFGGTVYHAFSRMQHVKRLEYDPTQAMFWTLDFNINPMCSLIGQVIESPVGQSVHVLQEIALPDSNTYQACETFVERARRWMVPGRPITVMVFGDASGGSRQSAGGTTDWNEVKRFFGRHAEAFRPVFRIRDGNPLVKDRVNCVNAALRNAEGNVRLFVDPSCVELIRDFEEVRWKSDRAGNLYPVIDKQKDPRRTHLSDALGYMIERTFPIRQVSAQAARNRPRIIL